MKAPGMVARRASGSAVAPTTMLIAVVMAFAFTPVTLSMPAAHDLGVIAGMAGQALSIFGLLPGTCWGFA